MFDLKDDDVYWCTADIGWVTGHSYVVYGPLANGATVVMYEGAPDWPEKDRFWEIVERYGVTMFYTAPTAIRAFMHWGTEWPAKHDLSSLRLLGSVGEPINPEAWMWYHLHIGGERCPIVDTWWQTETGAIMITPLPGITRTKPGSATQPFPGISAEILNDKGERVPVGGGLLALTRPWPSMLRGIYGDPDRYVQQYWSRWGKDIYFTGDGAKRDDDGYYWLLGRVDDVLNVAGHRIGTMEVESALVDHPKVAEAAVVGRPHEIKGQAIAAFVTVKEGVSAVGEPGRRAEEARRAARSARLPGPTTSSSPPTCRRRGRARSCGGCCATSPKARRSATPRRWPIRPSSRSSKEQYEDQELSPELGTAVNHQEPSGTPGTVEYAESWH